MGPSYMGIYYNFSIIYIVCYTVLSVCVDFCAGIANWDVNQTGYRDNNQIHLLLN